MSDTLERLQTRYEILQKTIRQLDKKLKSFPEGRIEIKHHHKGTHYCLAGTGQGVIYLASKEQELLEQLIQKSYLLKTQKAALAEAEVVKKAIDHYPDIIPENVYDGLTPERKLYAKPIVQDDNQYAAKWQSEPFKPKPFKEDAPEFYTLRGERVRSKSEIIIADRLYAKGIPYKYECPLKVGKEIIHPDFTILRLSDHKVLYHEHSGKMTDPEYTKDIPERAKKYMRAGIFQGDRLFYTFESVDCPLDVKALDAFIEKNYR